MEIKNQIVKVTFNESKRTVTLRTYQEGKYISKYRTYPMNKQAWRLVNGCEVRVRKAYTNGSSDPKDWTYCVSWYADGQLVECENGVRLEQAAKALNDLPRWAEAYCHEQLSQIAWA